MNDKNEQCWFTQLLNDPNSPDFFSEFYKTYPVILYPDSLPEFAQGLNAERVLDMYAERAKNEKKFKVFNKNDPTMRDEDVQTGEEPNMRSRERLSSIFEHEHPRKAMEDLAKKETFTIRGIHRKDDSYSDFVSKCSLFWRSKTSVNCYLVHQGSDRLPVHYDAHHIFAIHTHGVKRWFFWPPVIKWPRSCETIYGVDSPNQKPLIFDVRAGEVLYIPIGWYHRTESLSDSVVHLTIGVRHSFWAVLRRAYNRRWRSKRGCPKQA